MAIALFMDQWPLNFRVHKYKDFLAESTKYICGHNSARPMISPACMMCSINLYLSMLYIDFYIFIINKSVQFPK